MMKTPLTILLTLLSFWCFGQTPHLFQIVQNDKVGYINEKGKVVIEPVFVSGNDFSEGLAAVRLNGLYGFINESGVFAIEPGYDFATDFLHGLAVVYKDGAPLLIDKKGNIVLPQTYAALQLLDSNKAIVTTHTKKQGLVNVYTNQLLIDTAFSRINYFTNGVSIVDEYIKPTKKQKQKSVGVVDTTGKFIVPFGKYQTIRPFVEGYATVEINDKRNKDGNIDGVIDREGNLLFKRPYQNNSYVHEDFHEGYAIVNLYKYWIPEEKGIISTSDKNYEGYINLKGEVVFNDTNYRYVTPFGNGRAFIKEDGKKYILIDKNFKRVGNNEFENIPGKAFKNNYAVVQTGDGFGIIDTLGNFVTKSDYREISSVGLADGYFIFSFDTDDNKIAFGIGDLKGNIICKPVLQDFDRSGYVNDLVKVIMDEKLSYLNKRGDIVWQQQTDTSTALENWNVDFMMRGRFYAYSTPKNTGADKSGGWATSRNKPKQIMDRSFPGNSLSITIDSNTIVKFGDRFAGMKLFISNTTNDTVKLNAQDSRLYMKLQAQNSKGEWKDIEYLPSSWCGNSYHEIELEPNAFWEFTIPKFNGELQTKIRAELKYIDEEKQQTEKVVYSNIINASINPGQFWNKRAYQPSGLMDPYND